MVAAPVATLLATTASGLVHILLLSARVAARVTGELTLVGLAEAPPVVVEAAKDGVPKAPAPVVLVVVVPKEALGVPTTGEELETPVVAPALTLVVVVVVLLEPAATPATPRTATVVVVAPVRSGLLLQREAGAQRDAVAVAAPRTSRARMVPVVRAAVVAAVVAATRVRMVVQTSVEAAVVAVATPQTARMAARVVQAPSFSNMKPHI